MLTSKWWSYNSKPIALADKPPEELWIQKALHHEPWLLNRRELCITSTTLGALWHSDFGKVWDAKLVQIEAQFGKVESMFKDFYGFKIAWHERRLALGIEIVMCDPNRYFSHRRSSTSGMAYFDNAKKTLPAIGLGCPICLVGIKD